MLIGVDGDVVNLLVNRSPHEIKATVVTKGSPLRVDNHLRVQSISYIGSQSNVTNRPHRRRTWTIQSYSTGYANMHLQFLWPTRVHNPNGISMGSTVFAGLTIVTD